MFLLAFDFAHDIAALATLIVAITGFVTMILRQGQTDKKVDATEVTVQKVYKHVNGSPVEEGQPLTLGQEVRKMHDDMEAIKRELGIKD